LTGSARFCHPPQILIITAIVTLIFGQDHPAGKWSQRHLTPATAAAVQAGHEVKMDHAEIKRMQEKKAEPEGQTNMVREVSPDEDEESRPVEPKSTVVGLPEGQIVELDVAVNETLTVKSAIKILVNPLTWLPALA
jgi:NNP family nitrate/nitrite transporter-like MFS transporter